MIQRIKKYKSFINQLFGMNILHWINNQLPIPIISSPTPNLYRVGESIYFDGSDSYDPEEQPLTYSWSSDMDGEIGNESTFDHVLSSRGKHVITLVVSDGFRSTNSSVEIILNTPPEAIILSPQDESFFTPGTEITFTAEEDTDPDGDDVTYFWNFVPWTFNSTESEFSLSNLSIGNHMIYLTVTDTFQEFSISIVHITINNPPSSSISSPTRNSIYQQNEIVTFLAEPGFDKDDHELSYEWESSVDGFLGDGEEIQFTLTPGPHIITMRVSDGYQKTSYESEIFVNSPPVAIIGSPLDQSLFLANDYVQCDASESWDNDSEYLSYLWESNIDGEIGDDPTFSTRLSSGDHTIILTVEDDHGGISTSQVFVIINTPPKARIDSPEDGTIHDQTTDILFDASSSTDPEDTLMFSWVSDIDGLIGTGAVLTSTLTPGQHTIELFVNDSRGGLDEDRVIIWVNTPPVANIAQPTEDQIFLTTDDILFDASASYDPEDDLTYLWESDLDGLIGFNLDFTTQLSSGIHAIILSVDDGRGGFDQIEVTIEVKSPPEVLLLYPGPGTKIDGSEVLLNWRGSDDDDDTLIYNVYIGTSNPPIQLVALGIPLETYQVSNLQEGTTYFWKVIVSDGHTTTESTVGSFQILEKEEDSGIDDTTVIASISAGVIIILVIFMVVFVRRRKRNAYYDYYDEWYDDEEDEW